MENTETKPWKYGGPPDMKELERTKEQTKKQKKQPEETPAQTTSCPLHAEDKSRQADLQRDRPTHGRSRVTPPPNLRSHRDTHTYRALTHPHCHPNSIRTQNNSLANR